MKKKSNKAVEYYTKSIEYFKLSHEKKDYIKIL